MTKRVITAFLMAVFMAAIILFLPVPAFRVFVALIVAAALFEFFRLVISGDALFRYLATFAGAIISFMMVCRVAPEHLIFVLIGGVFLAALYQMRHSTVLEGVTERLGLAFFGIMYLGLTLPFFGWLRELPHGRTLLFMSLSAAALCDTAAYFIGKGIGRRKFAPLTSPNKTWEGFFGGFLGSVLGVFIFRYIGWPELNLSHVLCLGILIGLVAPLGDLIESMIKRDYHVKDSGDVIPGHGGVLDRIDAQIFTGPAVYFYVKWVIL